MPYRRENSDTQNIDYADLTETFRFCLRPLYREIEALPIFCHHMRWSAEFRVSFAPSHQREYRSFRKSFIGVRSWQIHTSTHPWLFWTLLFNPFFSPTPVAPSRAIISDFQKSTSLEPTRSPPKSGYTVNRPFQFERTYQILSQTTHSWLIPLSPILWSPFQIKVSDRLPNSSHLAPHRGSARSGRKWDKVT